MIDSQQTIFQGSKVNLHTAALCFLLGHAETISQCENLLSNDLFSSQVTRELQFHAFYNLFTHHLFTKEVSLAEFFFSPCVLNKHID